MMGSLTTSLAELDRAMHDVVEANGMLGNAQANRGSLAAGTTALGFRGIERAAFPGIDWAAAGWRAHTLAVTLQLLLGAEAEIGLAFAQQPLGLFTVEIETVALAIGRMWAADIGTFVPVEAEPFQVVEKLAFKALLAALDVGVLDAQDHDAALLPREKPVE